MHLRASTNAYIQSCMQQTAFPVTHSPDRLSVKSSGSIWEVSIPAMIGVNPCISLPELSVQVCQRITFGLSMTNLPAAYSTCYFSASCSNKMPSANYHTACVHTTQNLSRCLLWRTLCKMQRLCRYSTEPLLCSLSSQPSRDMSKATRR